MVYHTLEPLYDAQSKVLILGSMPSIKSREIGFYYAHPQNRFYRVLASLFDEELPKTIEEKKAFLSKHHIALFDVLKTCDIKGSSDSSITNISVNDFTDILGHSQICAIFTTGKKSHELYQKYCYPKTKIAAIPLPSTSSANIANYSLDQLIMEYRVIKKYVN